MTLLSLVDEEVCGKVATPTKGLIANITLIGLSIGVSDHVLV